MLGATFTVSDASLLVAEPHVLVTTQLEFVAASPAPAGLIVSVMEVAPEISPPLTRLAVPFRHWNVGAGVPEAETAKLVDAPAQTVWFEGCPVIEAATLTVSAALLLVAEPH